MNSVQMSNLAAIPTRTQVKAPKFGSHHSPADLIHVTSTGTVNQKPDGLQVYFTIQEVGENKAEVTSKVNEQAEKLNAAVKALNLPKAKLSSQVSEWKNQHPKTKKTTHTTTFNLNVSLKGAKADDLSKFAAQLSEASQAAGAQFNGPNYFISKAGAAEKRALKQAIDKAVSLAKNIAAGFGVSIDAKPVEVTVGESYNRGGGRRAFAAAASMESLSADGGGFSQEAFQVAEQSISSPQIQVAFKINKGEPSAAKPATQDGPNIHPLSPDAKKGAETLGGVDLGALIDKALSKAQDAANPLKGGSGAIGEIIKNALDKAQSKGAGGLGELLKSLESFIPKSGDKGEKSPLNGLDDLLKSLEGMAPKGDKKDPKDKNDPDKK